MIKYTCQNCKNVFFLYTKMDVGLVNSTTHIARHLIKVSEWNSEVDEHELGCAVEKALRFDYVN